MKLILFGIIAIMFTACNKDEVNQPLVDDEAIQNYIQENGLLMEEHASGMYYSIDEVGLGEAPGVGSFVEVKYNGKLLNGFEFDKTLDGKTSIFSTVNLISGWQHLLLLLKEGGKGTFILPSRLGYGSQDVGSGLIPGNSVLVFEIELVSIFDDQAEADEKIIQNYLADNDLEAVAHESGIYYIITEEGEGESPVSNSTVEVKYKGLITNGAVFKETADGETEIFDLDSFIEGWQIGIPLLKPGGKGTFLIPSALAFGEDGYGVIPPNTVLIFEIELVGFE
jgi:FKBP-type peptidyl-prolyl cis-trans isomerase